MGALGHALRSNHAGRPITVCCAPGYGPLTDGGQRDFGTRRTPMIPDAGATALPAHISMLRATVFIALTA
jgi:hypothetical protein